MNFAGECKSKVNLFYTKDSFALCLAECISSLFYIHTFFLPYFFIIFAEDKPACGYGEDEIRLCFICDVLAQGYVCLKDFLCLLLIFKLRNYGNFRTI